jgi:hypothetical protein
LALHSRALHGGPVEWTRNGSGLGPERRVKDLDAGRREKGCGPWTAPLAKSRFARRAKLW